MLTPLAAVAMAAIITLVVVVGVEASEAVSSLHTARMVVDNTDTHTVTFRAPVLIAATPGAELTADGFGAVAVDPAGESTVVYGPGHWTSYDSGRTWESTLPRGGLNMLPDTGWSGEPSGFPLPDGAGVHGLGSILDCPPPGCWIDNHTRATCVNVSEWVANRNRVWQACASNPPIPTSQEWMTMSPAVGVLRRNATDGKLWSSSSCKGVSFRGLPMPLNSTVGMCNSFTPPTRLTLADGSMLATFALVFNGETFPVNRFNQSITAHHLPMSLVVFRSVDSGFTWDFVSVAVNYTQIPGMPAGLPNPDNLTHSAYGPQENGMALLSDNKTILIAFRPDTDSMCPGGPVPYKYYYQVYSNDNGKTWSTPTPIHGVGCVRPRLHRLEGGPLLMTGGRLCPTLVPNTSFAGHGCLPQSVTGAQGGIFVWANLDGMADAPAGTTKGGSEWRTYCLGAIHNQLWEGDSK